MEDWKKELREAKAAGQEALDCLNRAADSLKSAGNWSVADMLGGGLITTFVKHSRMNDAEALVQQAKSALKRFRKELMDVENVAEFHIETGDFLAFADYFFDGIIADWLMHARINEARSQVEDARQKVMNIMKQLNQIQA